jgi:hypothetical protein
MAFGLLCKFDAVDILSLVVVSVCNYFDAEHHIVCLQGSFSTEYMYNCLNRRKIAKKVRNKARSEKILKDRTTKNALKDRMGRETSFRVYQEAGSREVAYLWSGLQAKRSG